jgi:hypothetical protein
MFGELAIMLWLIIMGAKERQPQASAPGVRRLILGD